MDGEYPIEHVPSIAGIELPALVAKLDRGGAAARPAHRVCLEAHPLFVACWRSAAREHYEIRDPHRVTLVFVLPDSARDGPDASWRACNAGRTAIVPPAVAARLTMDASAVNLAVCFSVTYVREAPLRKRAVGRWVDDHVLRRLGLALYECLQRADALDELESRAWATLLGAHVARYYAEGDAEDCESSIGANVPACVRAALRRIATDAETRWTVDKLAATVGTSRTTLSRSFKAAIGLSPHRYIVEQRVEKARELLSTTHLPLLEVAYSVGFSSQSHMTATFRRAVGVTPREYRAAANA